MDANTFREQIQKMEGEYEDEFFPFISLDTVLARKKTGELSVIATTAFGKDLEKAYTEEYGEEFTEMQRAYSNVLMIIANKFYHELEELHQKKSV